VSLDVAEEKYLSQLRRNCNACISTACITPDGILGCSVDKCSLRPFTWSGSVLVKVEVKLDIPVTGYLCFLAQDSTPCASVTATGKCPD
jgi:hypothetical protein